MKKSSTKSIWSTLMASLLAVALVVTGILPGTTMKASAAEADEQVAAFVERMYTQALGRNFDEKGKADWASQLTGHKSDGASLAYGFIRSKEFTDRKLSNADYVKVLYKTFFDREADQGGFDYWMKQLEAGTSRDTVLSGFVDSQEFAKLCVKFGISQGYMFPNGSVANPGIGLFVFRLYDKLLGRTPDGAGLLDWTKKIATGQISATTVATEKFIYSKEFQTKQDGMTDSRYLDVLYATFFDRPADEGGKSYWLEQLNYGADRKSIVNGFAGSKEFKTLQTNYNLTIGETKPYTALKDYVTENESSYWDYIANKTYDKDGNLIEELKYNYDANGNYLGYIQNTKAYDSEKEAYVGDLQKTYEYIVTLNAEGNMVKSVYKGYTFKDDQSTYFSSENTTTYNGKATNNYRTSSSSVSYSEAGQILSKSESTYDEEGNQKSQTWVSYFSDTDKIAHVTKYEYDKYSNIIGSEYVNYNMLEDGTYYMNSHYVSSSPTVDENGNVISTKNHSESYNVNGEVIYEYDSEVTFKYEKNRCIERIERDTTHDTYTSRSTHTYNANGQETSHENYYWTYTNYETKEGKWKLTDWSTFKYNENGSYIESINYTTEDGTTENGYIANKSVYDYKVIGGKELVIAYDSYYVNTTYDDETQTPNRTLAYSYGYSNDFNNKGLIVLRKNYTGNEAFEKTLDFYTKYFPTDFKYDVPLGTKQDVKTNEVYTADDKLKSYTVVTYELKANK